VKSSNYQETESTIASALVCAVKFVNSVTTIFHIAATLIDIDLFKQD